MTRALYEMPFAAAALWALGWNVAIFVVCLLAGEAAIRLWRRYPIGVERPALVTAAELGWAVSCVLLNALVTVAGMWLWRRGWIELRENEPRRVLVDFAVLFFAMDLGMYVSHRLAHIPAVFRMVHGTHHQYTSPRPLTLFVLNPLEVLGFGGLWLAVLLLYPASSAAIVLYLGFNVVFGWMGHLGVEPAPAGWAETPLARWVTTSSFHAGHHADRYHNFGFYTVIWDRLFGTLDPGYRVRGWPWARVK